MPLQFGEKQDGEEYPPRPSAYAVIIGRDNRILAVVDGPETLLPGGGIDEGEDAPTAVVREIMEETGYSATIVSRIGDANEFILLPKQKRNVNKTSSFFLVEIDDTPDPNVTPEHEPVWLAPEEFIKRTSHESHAWAVLEAGGFLIE